MRFLYAAAITLLVIFSAHSTSASSESPGQVEVRVGFVDEYRPLQLIKDFWSDYDRSCYATLDLMLKGKILAAAACTANFRIDEVTDDLGTNLMPPIHDVRTMARLRAAVPETTESNGASLTVPCKVSAAPRAATRIAHLRGKVEVGIATERAHVSIQHLKQALNAPVVDPVIMKINSQVALSLEPGTTNTLNVEISGAPYRFERIEVIDADSKTLWSALPVILGTPTISHQQIQLPRDADDSMTLCFTVKAAMKVITVPFDLRDIPLP